MKTLAQWRTHAQDLESIVADQQQRLKSVEASAAKTQELLESSLDERSRLLQAAQAILGADDSDAICREFITHMNSMIEADSTALYLIDHPGQQVTRADYYRRPEASDWRLDETRLSYADLMTGLSGQVIQTGQPVLSLSPDDGTGATRESGKTDDRAAAARSLSSRCRRRPASSVR